MDPLDDEELEPPGKPDFRRVSNGVPFVLNPEGKRVRYGRPSNVGKILDDDSNLTKWKLRTVVIGAAQRPELMALVSTLSPSQDKKQIQDIAEDCIVAGKGMERTVKGTAVHSMFDHIDNGDDWEPAPQFKALCDSYRNQLAAWGLEVIDVEVNCINDEYRLAGSMDRRYRTTKLLIAPDGSTIPIGAVLAADTKTGQVLEYASGTYATQLAAYATSMVYDVATDERHPFHPPTFQDWGLIVHADSGGSEVRFYWVDLNAGKEGLELARQVKQWRQRQDLLTLASDWEPQAAATGPVELPEPSRLASLHQHTSERVRRILGHSETAGKMLQKIWPVGIPGLKAGGHTWDDLQAIINVVSVVEFDQGLPTYPDWVDPDEPVKREQSKANHPSTRGRHITHYLQDEIRMHPRKDLIRHWVEKAKEGGIDPDINTVPLANSLLVFAGINTNDWQGDGDEALSQFLDGTLRGMGYQRGLLDLGQFDPAHAPMIVEAAHAIANGQAMMVYGEDGLPVIRLNVIRG